MVFGIYSMVVKLEQNESVNEIEVKITHNAEDKNVDRILSLLKTLDDKIECHLENRLKLINVSDIYYIESLNNETLIFSENNKYKTKLRLYQLIEKLGDSGFIQISKYCIININKLDSVRPLFNSRMEVKLVNGVRLDVTRKYLNGLKQIYFEDE